MNKEDRRDVAEKHQRQPLQIMRIRFIRNEYLQDETKDGERGSHKEQGPAANKQLKLPLPIAPDISRIIDGVRQHQKKTRLDTEATRSNSGVYFPQFRAQSLVRILPISVACGHQWKCEEHCPQQPEPISRPGLRIGCYPARIVIRSAGDESRAELLKKTLGFYRLGFYLIDLGLH